MERQKNIIWFVITTPILLWMLDDFAISYLKDNAVNYAFYLQYTLAVFILVFLFFFVLRRNTQRHQTGKQATLRELAIGLAFILSGSLIGHLGAFSESKYIRPALSVSWVEELNYLSLFMMETPDMTMLHFLFGTPLIVGVKELFFRRVLIDELEKSGSTARAVLVSALLYTLVFWGTGPLGLLSAFFWGLIYGYVYALSRSIKFSIACEWGQAVFWYTLLLTNSGYLD